jgi:hypothetical protein
MWGRNIASNIHRRQYSPEQNQTNRAQYSAGQRCTVPSHIWSINPLNAELNPIRHLLALAGAHHFVEVSRIKGLVCILSDEVASSDCKNVKILGD